MLPWSIILTATAAMVGGTQLFEAHLTGGSPRFCRTTSKCRNYALFVGQIIKYGLQIILGFGSNGLWDVNQINFIYALLSQIQLCRDYALFEGHFWPKFGDRRGTKTFL